MKLSTTDNPRDLLQVGLKIVLKREMQGLKVPSPLPKHKLNSKIWCGMAALTFTLTYKHLCLPVCSCICSGMNEFKAGDAHGAAAALPFIYCQGRISFVQLQKGHPGAEGQEEQGDSTEDGNKMERGAWVPEMRLGSGRSGQSLVSYQRVVAVRSCCSLSPTHTCQYISGLPGLPSPSPHKMIKVLSLCRAIEISAPFQQTHLLCRPAIKHGGAVGQGPWASRRSSHLPATEPKSMECSRKLLSPVWRQCPSQPAWLPWG